MGPELEAFRAEVRAFVEEFAPPDTAAGGSAQRGERS